MFKIYLRLPLNSIPFYFMFICSRSLLEDSPCHSVENGILHTHPELLDLVFLKETPLNHQVCLLNILKQTLLLESFSLNKHVDSFLYADESPICVLSQSLRLNTVNHQQTSCNSGVLVLAVAQIRFRDRVCESHSDIHTCTANNVTFEPHFPQAIQKTIGFGCWLQNVRD